MGGRTLQICEIIVKNYRNFKNLKVNFTNFNLIIGENNIGKTNLVKLIEGVLNPNKHYRQFYLKESDFIDLNKPIELIIKFNNLTDIDEKNIDSHFIDPDDKTITLDFKSLWNDKEKITQNICKFIQVIDDSSLKPISEFNFDIKQNFQYYLIQSVRDAKDAIKFRKNSDLSEILRMFLPYFIISINALKKEIISNANLFLERTKDLDFIQKSRNEISNDFNKFIEFPSEFKEEDKTRFYPLYEKIINYDSEIKKILSENEVEIPKGFAEEITTIFCIIIENLKIFQKRFENHLLLNKLKGAFTELKGIKDLNQEFKNVINLLIPNINLELSFLSIKDNELFNDIIIEMNSFSLFEQGTGYQSYFVIALKLLKIKSTLDAIGIKSVILTVEEPEAHLHPHLQRQLINNLKLIQQDFKENFEIDIQFIITSHSSNIVKKIEYNELRILRKDIMGFTSCIEVPDDVLDQILDKILNTEKNDIKLRKSKRRPLINTFSKIFSFYPEIFFSKIVVIGEGDSEEGAIPIFASTLDMDFDNYGISYLNSEGTGNIEYYSNILDIFSIPYLYIKDRDKGQNIPNLENAYITERKAFESEILESLPLYKILEIFITLYEDDTINKMLNEIKKNEPSLAQFKEFDDILTYLKDIPNKDDNLNKLFLIWMKNRKSLMLGKFLASKCEKDEIPNVYKKIITDAVEYIKKSGWNV